MTRLFQTLRFSLPLAASLALVAAHAQAAPVSPLSTLSAKLQGSTAANRDKSLSETFAPPPILSTLAGTQKKLAGRGDIPKRLRLDPQMAPKSAFKTRLPVQFKGLALRLGRDSARPAPAKQIDAQLSATPSL